MTKQLHCRVVMELSLRCKDRGSVLPTTTTTTTTTKNSFCAEWTQPVSIVDIEKNTIAREKLELLERWAEEGLIVSTSKIHVLLTDSLLTNETLRTEHDEVLSAILSRICDVHLLRHPVEVDMANVKVEIDLTDDADMIKSRGLRNLVTSRIQTACGMFRGHTNEGGGARYVNGEPTSFLSDTPEMVLPVQQLPAEAAVQSRFDTNIINRGGQKNTMNKPHAIIFKLRSGNTVVYPVDTYLPDLRSALDSACAKLGHGYVNLNISKLNFKTDADRAYFLAQAEEYVKREYFLLELVNYPFQ